MNTIASGHRWPAVQVRLTIGKAAKYLSNAFWKPGRCIVMMQLSITVAFWIIQMSLMDRAINEPATATSRALSTLHTPGIIIPTKETQSNHN